MKWNIDDVPIYVSVVEHKSVSEAARSLNISKSTVSKALSRLEQSLGVRLMERNSRNLRITSEGEIFYRHAQLIMEQVSDTDSIMAGLASEPYGRLMVSLPVAFAREFVAPKLESFRQHYPKVELEILISSHQVDVIRDQIDIAVVVGALTDSELIAKHLYESKLICVTSPAYAAQQSLHDAPAETLSSHIKICEKRYGLAHFSVRIDGVKKSLDLDKGVIHVNDPIAVREAVVNGCGVTFLPDQYCKEAIKQGDLVPVFEAVKPEASAAKLSAVYPSRRLMPNKTRAFLDFLVEICELI